MTIEALVEEIQAKNPNISKAEIMERLEAERVKCGGLFGDETLLRLIAAKIGVKVQQNSFTFGNGTITSGRLFSGLYDVNVSGRLVAVFAARTFQGQEKSGKFATLMLGDNDGLLRVVLWNEKAELVERGELKAGQTVRFLHGYTRDDRYGKTELHLGDKSKVEFPAVEENVQCPPVEKFTQKIGSLNSNSGSVHVCGSVKAVLGKTGFTRGDSDGVVLRLALRDDSGEAVVVVWNEKVDEVEKKLRDGTRLVLVNARVKEGKNAGGFEVHVDSNTAIDVLSS